MVSPVSFVQSAKRSSLLLFPAVSAYAVSHDRPIITHSLYALVDIKVSCLRAVHNRV
jgi:hypothetical protein